MRKLWHLSKSVIDSQSHAAILHRARLGIEALLARQAAKSRRGQRIHFDSAHLHHAFGHHIGQYGDEGLLRMGLMLRASGHGDVQDDDIALLNRLPFTLKDPTPEPHEVGMDGRSIPAPMPSMIHRFFNDFAGIILAEDRAEGYKTLLATPNKNRQRWFQNDVYTPNLDLEIHRISQSMNLHRANIKRTKEFLVSNSHYMQILNSHIGLTIRRLKNDNNFTDDQINQDTLVQSLKKQLTDRQEEHARRESELARYQSQLMSDRMVTKKFLQIRKKHFDTRDKTIHPNSVLGRQIRSYIRRSEQDAAERKTKLYDQYPFLKQYEGYFRHIIRTLPKHLTLHVFNKFNVDSRNPLKTIYQTIIQDKQMGAVPDGYELQADGTTTRINRPTFEHWRRAWGLFRNNSGNLIDVNPQDINKDFLDRVKGGGIWGSYQQTRPGFTADGDLMRWITKFAPRPARMNAFRKLYHGLSSSALRGPRRGFPFFDPKYYEYYGQNYGIGAYNSTTPIVPRSIRTGNYYAAISHIPRTAKILHHDQDYSKTTLPAKINDYFENLAKYMNAPELQGAFKETLEELNAANRQALMPGNAFSPWFQKYYSVGGQREADEADDQRGWRLGRTSKRTIGDPRFPKQRRSPLLRHLTSMDLPGHLLFRAIKLTFEKFGATGSPNAHLFESRPGAVPDDNSVQFHPMLSNKLQQPSIQTPYRSSAYHAGLLLSSLGYRGYKHFDFETRDVLKAIGPWKYLPTRVRTQIGGFLRNFHLQQQWNNQTPSIPIDRIEDIARRHSEPTEDELRASDLGGLMTEKEADNARSVVLFPSALADLPPLRWGRVRGDTRSREISPPRRGSYSTVMDKYGPRRMPGLKTVRVRGRFAAETPLESEHPQDIPKIVPLVDIDRELRRLGIRKRPTVSASATQPDHIEGTTQ